MVLKETLQKNYPIILQQFKERECEITMSLEDFIINGQNVESINEITVKYKTKCGHENFIRIKTFLKNIIHDNCKHCQNYEILKKEFEEKGCQLLLNNEEFIEKYEEKKSIGNISVPYIEKCGHKYKITIKSFRNKNVRLCLDCSNKNNHSPNEDGSSKQTSQEDKAIDYLKEIKEIKEKFDIKRTINGCLADLGIKLKTELDDKWTQI
jgi:hypothetical protein